jgi:3-deoxy-D-manno-octulosonate 8-phosphate phosphatase (KDO 8-P phosphatase)
MRADVRYPPELLLKAQAISLVFFDVDGVLTDGGLYFSARGETLKQFNALDGHGIKLLQRVGIVPAIITGRDSKPLRLRLHALGITHVHFGVEDKYPAAQATLAALGLPWSSAAAMGDDWPDLALIQRCAFSAAPPNAHEEVLARVDLVTRRLGGLGAAREFCDLLLIASGRYSGLLTDACR